MFSLQVGFDLLQALPYLVGLAAIAIIVVIFYVFYYKPRVDLPLQGERLIGQVRMWIPHGFGLFAGPMTTGRRTLEMYWTGLIQNEKDDAVRRRFEENRDFCFKQLPHVFAMKTGGKTKILLFDRNPEDQRFLSYDPEHGEFLLHGIQDVKKVQEGKKGWEIIGFKLSEKRTKFTEQEEKVFASVLDNFSVIRKAAESKELITVLEDDVRRLTGLTDEMGQTIREVSSDRDGWRKIADKKNLLESREVKIPGQLREKLKEWFTWPQVITAGLAYFLAPHILVFANLQLNEPEITYAVLLVSLVGFFIIPVGKKLFGRWL